VEEDAIDFVRGKIRLLNPNGFLFRQTVYKKILQQKQHRGLMTALCCFLPVDIISPYFTITG
jgi:hypothetical protein